MRKPKLGRRRVARKHWQRKERREKKAERARSKQVMYALGRIGDAENQTSFWHDAGAAGKIEIRIDKDVMEKYVKAIGKAERITLHDIRCIE